MTFFWKKVKIAISQYFEIFTFFHSSDLSARFLAIFQQFGMESVSNVYLLPILLSPGNNSISIKWALYL